HISLPSWRSKHNVSSDFLPPAVVCEVTKTRLPKTTGELVPQPGNCTDQRMFSILLQCVGRSRPSATPSAFGPRQRGQSVGGTCLPDFSLSWKTPSAPAAPATGPELRRRKKVPAKQSPIQTRAIRLPVLSARSPASSPAMAFCSTGNNESNEPRPTS